MPFNHESKSLKEFGFKADYQQVGITNLANSVGNLQLMKVLIEGKNTKLSLDNTGWKWFRSADAIATTRLDERQTEVFLQKLPNFLRHKTSERGDLDFVISRPLGDNVNKQIEYCIRFIPGYANPDKSVMRNHKKGNFVATAYYPEVRHNRAYAGREIDGRWIDFEKSEDEFTRYMRLKGETERWGFITSEKRPTAGDCEQFVCIHPWEMEQQEFIDFSREALLREETQEMVLTTSCREEKGDKTFKRYDFRARLFPHSNNVEIVVTGPAKEGYYVGNMFGDSLDLFGIRLSDKDKISYYTFYEKENKKLEALRNAGVVVGGAIATPFIYLGKGARKAGGTVRTKWRDYQYNKQREIREIKMELDAEGIPINATRTGSCYIGLNKECVLRKVQKKKEQSTAY